MRWRAALRVAVISFAGLLAGCDGRSPTEPGCSFSLYISTGQFGPAGGAANVIIWAPVGCEWTASASASWISIQGGASGSGDGSLSFVIAPSTEPQQRRGALRIGAQIYTITQTAARAASTRRPQADR